MQNEIYCSHCKDIKGPFVKYSKNSKFPKQYYYCVKCNTIKCKKYRKSDIGKIKAREAAYRSMAKFRIKNNARHNLNYHLKKGHIVKPRFCEDCGLKDKIFAHHTDYSKPLKIKWLCRRCHADKHKRKSLIVDKKGDKTLNLVKIALAK